MSRIPNPPPPKDEYGNYIKPKPPKNPPLTEGNVRNIEKGVNKTNNVKPIQPPPASPPGFKMKDYRYGLREIVVTPQHYKKLYDTYMTIDSIADTCAKIAFCKSVTEPYFFGFKKRDVLHSLTKQEVQKWLEDLIGDNTKLLHFFEIKFYFEEYRVFTNKYRTALGDIIALCDTDKETTIYATPDMILVYKLII